MRRKQEIPEFGTWPLLRPEIIEFVTEWPEDITLDGWRDLMPLVHAAIHPEILKLDNPGNDLRRDFCRMFADHPKFTVALLAHVQRIISRQDHRWIVQRFLRLNATVQHPDRKKPVSTSSLTDGEVARVIRAETKLIVGESTVKKARQLLKGPKAKNKSL